MAMALRRAGVATAVVPRPRPRPILNRNSSSTQPRKRGARYVALVQWGAASSHEKEALGKLCGVLSSRREVGALGGSPSSTDSPLDKDVEGSGRLALLLSRNQSGDTDSQEQEEIGCLGQWLSTNESAFRGLHEEEIGSSGVTRSNDSLDEQGEIGGVGQLPPSNDAPDRYETQEETGSGFRGEGDRRMVVYLEPWQMKKMVAASNLGAGCVNVEALAAEVGLDGADVLAWLQNAPCNNIILNTSEGSSYMDDVYILEEAERPAVYVPAPPIPSRDVRMRNKVEDLMYALKDIIPGPLAAISADETKLNAAVELFSETVELQNPLFCLRGRVALVEWFQLLGHLGVTVKLHDIYYANIANEPRKRWVYATWTATLTDDLQQSVAELGLSDWWARCHGPELVEGKQDALGNYKRALQLSGECKFEMAAFGQVTTLHTRWYTLAKQGGEEDLTDAKLWLSGVLRRGLC